MIRAVIIDDESKAIENLQWELEHFCPDVEVAATFTQPSEALQFLSHEGAQVDVVFLDINMPGMSGLEWMQRFGLRDFEVVIISAHDEYVLDTMKQEVYDFLVKPVETESLMATVQRLGQRLTRTSMIHNLEARLGTLLESHGDRSKANFSLGHQQLFIYLDEILYVKAEGNYCELYHKKGGKYLLSHIMREVMEKLDDRFFRVHNSYVVNLDRVTLYDKKSAYLEMEDGTQIPISRRRRVDFLSHM